jgi:hypothetical protein
MTLVVLAAVALRFSGADSTTFAQAPGSLHCNWVIIYQRAATSRARSSVAVPARMDARGRGQFYLGCRSCSCGPAGIIAAPIRTSVVALVAIA